MRNRVDPANDTRLAAEESKQNTHRSNSNSVRSNALLQIKDNRAESLIQRQLKDSINENKFREESSASFKVNRTGLPDSLKIGVENLSGYSMDDVKVHYNSNKPAQLNAHAYAQGNQIHLAPGQEKQLPHEAWHVVQQKQGRVRPTMQLKGNLNINDDKELEKEADVMGRRASLYTDSSKTYLSSGQTIPTKPFISNNIVQCVTSIVHTYSYITPDIGDRNTKYKVGRKVVAKLDPEDPVKGSATGAFWDWMGPMREVYGNIVKGHLLNHDLGGFAKEENLYPITSKANQEHSSRVEQKVKHELFERPHNETRRLHYEVKVVENKRHDPTKAQFHCWWGWEAGYISRSVKLGEAIIDSNMMPQGRYGGFQGLDQNKYPMLGGSDVAAKWYHGNRAEERPDVNKDWVENQKGWSGSKISVWGAADTYGTFGGIKDADKTSINKLPAIIRDLHLALELIDEPWRWMSRQIDDNEFDMYFASSFKESLRADFHNSLIVGEGQARRISNYIADNGIYALSSKLQSIIEGICPEIIQVMQIADYEIHQRWSNKADRHPDNAFVMEWWDAEDRRIVDSAKLDIIEIIEAEIDKVGWQV